MSGRVHPSLIKQIRRFRSYRSALRAALTRIFRHFQNAINDRRIVRWLGRCLILISKSKKATPSSRNLHSSHTFSEDERLLDGYRTGKFDIHDLTSTGLNLDRDTAKEWEMGILTEMQLKALSRSHPMAVGRGREDQHEFLVSCFQASDHSSRKPELYSAEPDMLTCSRATRLSWTS